MEINYRMIGILEMIFSANGKIATHEAIVTLGMTKRSLMYHIEKTNSFLHELHVTPIDVNRGQIQWDISQEATVRLALSQQENLQYVMSKQERKGLIAIYAAIRKKPVTIEFLCTDFDVSRNTVLTEVVELKSELEEIGLRLNSSGRNGYRLMGEETTIRYYVMESYYKLETQAILQKLQGVVIAEAGKVAHKDITPDVYEQLCAILGESEQHTSLKFNGDSIREMALYLLIILIRSAAGYHIALGNELHNRSEYKAAEEILNKMKELGLVISEKEQPYITTILLSSKVFEIAKLSNKSGANLESFVRDIIATFQAKACINFHDEEELVARLLLHVRPMYYRLKYKIKVYNILEDDIRIRYKELYNITEQTVRTVAPKYGLQVPDDEITFLCVYIGSFMNKQISTECPCITNILIVCGTGVGTSLLLREQISPLLGKGFGYIIKDEREARLLDFTKYALVVTTVALPYSGENLIRVHPLLTKKQKNELLSWSCSNINGEESGRVEDILNIVKKHAAIKDEEELTNQLLGYLKQGILQRTKQKAGLREVVSPADVNILDEKMEPAEVLEYCCKTLVERKIVTSQYPESIFNIIDTLGLYAEVAEGILLAHGKPDEAVCGLGLTITLLKQPVVFPKWNREIYVIFTLATPNNEDHLVILRDVMRILQNKVIYQQLLECQFETSKEAYDIIMLALEIES